MKRPEPDPLERFRQLARDALSAGNVPVAAMAVVAFSHDPECCCVASGSLWNRDDARGECDRIIERLARRVATL